MLKIWFDLCRMYGIDELLVNVHLHIEAVRRFVETNSGGLRVHLFEEPVLRGSAGTILANRDWVKKEDFFWVFYADVLTSMNLEKMLHFHNTRGQCATISVYEVPDPSRCGIVQLDGTGIVRDFVEKPQNSIGNLAFAGLMICTPLILDLIPEQPLADLGYHVLPKIIGRMAAYRVPDFLIDVGTLETYKIAQMNWPGLRQSHSLI